MEKFITIPCIACKGTGKQKRVNPAYLRKCREDAGISLREFARRLGCSASHISDVELGRRYPSTEVGEAYKKLTKK